MNCKPGDLAIVVSAFHCTENIGRIVEVVRLAIKGTDYMSDRNAPSWIVRSSRPLGRIAYHGSRRLAPASETICADANLRPVSGLPIDDEVTQDLKEPA